MFILVLTGCSRSGKSTLAQSLRTSLSCSIETLVIDDFYFQESSRGPFVTLQSGQPSRDWDDPSHIDWDAFHHAISLLLSPGGEKDDPPSDASESPSKGLLILDGFCLLHSPLVRRLAHLVVFLNLTEADARQRRTNTDQWVAANPDFFDKSIWPHHLRYVTLLHQLGYSFFNANQPVTLKAWRQLSAHASPPPAESDRRTSMILSFPDTSESERILADVSLLLSSLMKPQWKPASIRSKTSTSSILLPPLSISSTSTPSTSSTSTSSSTSICPSASSSSTCPTSSSASTQSYLDSLSRYFFFPPNPQPPPPFDSVFNPHISDSTIFAYVRCPRASLQPDGLRRAVIFYHGNGECVDNCLVSEDFIPPFARLGYDVCLVEYRGYGFYNRQHPPLLVSMLADTTVIHRKVTGYGVPSENIVVMGRSIGTIYAAEHAKNHPDVHCLILESGFAEPSEFLARAASVTGETDLDRLRKESLAHVHNADKVAGFTGKLVIIHAVDDKVVPVAQAELNFSSSPLSEEKKKLVIFPLGGHNFMRHCHFFTFWQTIALACHPDPTSILQDPVFHKFDLPASSSSSSSSSNTSSTTTSPSPSSSSTSSISLNETPKTCIIL